MKTIKGLALLSMMALLLGIHAHAAQAMTLQTQSAANPTLMAQESDEMDEGDEYADEDMGEEEMADEEGMDEEYADEEGMDEEYADEEGMDEEEVADDEDMDEEEVSDVPEGGEAVAAAGGDDLEPGDMIIIEADDEDFTAGEEYEVMEDQDDELFVEDDNGDTWNITEFDGENVTLEHDGRVVMADDVDE
ncbi:MAG: hypothetical protein MUF49_07155 [Oculatellaceae cyanobacterium Prado106]|jgi:hypothetical protein|nr:hypothetical protein [Oculatellaceae cyanobacterium Prado106]